MTRVTVNLDDLQLAWLESIAELHGCSRSAVLRQALCNLSARESIRVERTRRFAVVRALAKAERFDPITDYLAGH